MGLAEDMGRVGRMLVKKIKETAPEIIESDHFSHQEDAYWSGVDHAIYVIEEYFSE